MSFLGMTMGGLHHVAAQSGELLAKPRGGLFGSGITGDQIVQALGALRSQEAPIEHARFVRIGLPPIDLSGLYAPPMQRRQTPPLGLAAYFQQLGQRG